MKKLKKLNLTHHADLLNDYEMKMIVGGYSLGYESGTMEGFSCREGKCLVDIRYEDGNIWCDQEMPMEVCRRFGGFQC